MNPESNDPLDSILKEQETYIEDAGFTGRVMASLPKRKRGLMLRVVLLPGSALLGLVLAFYFLQGADFSVLGQSDANFQLFPIMLWLLPLVMAAIAIIWGIVVAYNEEG